MESTMMKFKRLLVEATDGARYDEEAKQFGSTMAGIKMNARRDAFLEFCDANAAEILQRLET